VSFDALDGVSDRGGYSRDKFYTGADGDGGEVRFRLSAWQQDAVRAVRATYKPLNSTGAVFRNAFVHDLHYLKEKTSAQLEIVNQYEDWEETFAELNRIRSHEEQEEGFKALIANSRGGEQRERTRQVIQRGIEGTIDLHWKLRFNKVLRTMDDE
jgi:hypothetical protein